LIKPSILLAGILCLAASRAGSEEPLAIFDGVWSSVTPPGPQIIFNKISGGLRQATLPVLGAATITLSDGRDASNLKVSGLGFDCYYLFGIINAREMTWNKQSGPAVCPASSHFKKIQASEEGSSLMTRYFGASLGDQRTTSNGLVRTDVTLTPYGLQNVGLYDKSVITLAQTQGVSKTVELYSRLGSNTISLIIAIAHYNYGDLNDKYLYSSFLQILSAIGIKPPPQLKVSTTPVSQKMGGTHPTRGTPVVDFYCSATKYIMSPQYTDNFIITKYFERNDINATVTIRQGETPSDCNSFDTLKKYISSSRSPVRVDNTWASVFLTNEK
jgi:hypothetical protein